MKKVIFICLLLLPGFIFSQQRYYDEIFSQVQVFPDIQYGSNYSLLSGTPVLSDLFLDIYTPPAGDTVTTRPLIVFLHTGRFLPPSINQRCTGTRKDSAVVELCTRFAKRGYVAAAVSYRLGWNQISFDNNVRTGSYVNALYKGVQDAKSAVRFFRNNALNGANTYGIDQSKIILGGQGDGGGSIALAFLTLDNNNELLLNKFKNDVNGVPFVDTILVGDYDCLQNATYNNANTPNVTSDVYMVFNLGGALADSSWIQGGERPLVSFQCPSDPFSPYQTGNILALTTGDFILEASGSYDVVRKSYAAGNQNLWVGGFNDAFTQRANAINDGYEGLFPFITQSNQSEPWEWWDVNCSNNANGLLVNPDMSSAKGRAYIDTIIGYLNPRIINHFQQTPCSAGFALFPDSIIAHNWFVQNMCTGEGPIDYMWYWGDGDSTAGSNPSHVYSAPGYYNICVKILAANNCYDFYCDSSVYIYKADADMISISVIGGPISIKEKEKERSRIYPNPANNLITIESEVNKGFYTLTDVTGKTLLQGSVNSEKFTLDLSSLSSGVYFITVANSERQVVGKVVKE